MTRKYSYFKSLDEIGEWINSNYYPDGAQVGQTLTEEQQIVLADIIANPRILFTPKYTNWRNYIRRESPKYLDRLFESLPYKDQDDIFRNNIDAFSALSIMAKGRFCEKMIRNKSNGVSPYFAAGLGATLAAPFAIEGAITTLPTALQAFGNTAVGRALSSTPARIAYGLNSANSLASEDGLAKTKRLYNEGDYLGTAKSGAGDLLDLLVAGDGVVQGAKAIINGAKALYNAPVIGQYPRYIGGKIKFGMDAELPILYKKLDVVPEVKNGKVTLTNTPSRFRYAETGEDPIITNFTTDVPVRSHRSNNWDDLDVIAIDGKSLLGKKVVSTRPSDTFTYGEPIRVKAKNTLEVLLKRTICLWTMYSDQNINLK